MSKFLLDEDEAMTFSEDKTSKLKQCNAFIINTLIYLMEEKGDSNKIDKEFYTAIMNRELPRIADRNDCFAKLRFLILALKKDDQRVAFLNSGIIKNYMEPLLKGYVHDIDKVDSWDNYVNIANGDKDVINKSPFRASMYCYRESGEEAEIGLDFSKIIDTIVKVDNKGRYYLACSTEIDDRKELAQAAQETLKLFRSHEKFKKNFYNYELQDASENE